MFKDFSNEIARIKHNDNEIDVNLARTFAALYMRKENLPAGDYYEKFSKVFCFDDFAIKEMKELYIRTCSIPYIISPINADGTKISAIIERIREYDICLSDRIIFSVQLHKIFKLP